MNIARTCCIIRPKNIGIFRNNIYRKFRHSSINRESSQPAIQEEKFDFEDIKVLERTERRKPQIEPFIKNVFVSKFNRDLLAYPEILNKEESEAIDERLSILQKYFSDPARTREERKKVLVGTKMYAAPVNLTNGGLASNVTENLRYLDVISSDPDLGYEISDHWVGLEVLKKGLEVEKLQQIIDDLITGEKPIMLCIKEKISERLSQADFRTTAELDSQSIWRVSGEKLCQNKDGYYLVLCAVENERLKMFLIHPGSHDIEHKGKFIHFRNTPATPLDVATEQTLSHTLGLSRLYAATLCRASFRRGLQYCIDYTRSKVFSGKPLSEAPTIRSNIGEALLLEYACESAEYFTAGLLDGYMDPDAELEMAMCRNFITTHGMPKLLQILTIPSVEEEEQCNNLLNEMRHLTLKGESLEGINMFIGLNGIHHAGKVLHNEVKKMRNPLFHPSFILKKVLADRKQEKDDPKLDLFLIEHLHPTLKIPSEYLEYCVLRMRYACETLLARHGMEVANAHAELTRLAEAATEILAMTSVLARASRSYCIGLRNAEVEMKLAACFVNMAKDRVRKLIKDVDDGEFLNLDHFRIHFGKRVLDTNTLLVEKPTARTFW